MYPQKNRSSSPTFLIFVFVFLIVAALLVACGPAVVPAPETAPGAAVEPADSAELPIGLDIVQTDAKGIEVGFTAEGRPYRGDPNAAVVIEEFSDYQCPYCGRFVNQTLPFLEDNQIANGEALLVYYDFPLDSIHPQATAAANAARCAGEQGAAAYWAMHDVIFASVSQWSNGNPNAAFSSFGQDLGLEMESFNSCLQSNKYFEQIQADVDLGRSRGVNSTPSFFINEQPFIGAQPVETFNSAIATIQNGGQIAANEPSPATQPAVAPTPAVIGSEGIAAAMGNPNAPVTIVEYTDYQCPYCRRHATETMPQIISQMVEADQVYYVVKDFPLDSIHPQARAAAVAARCADEQEAYWGMHDALFAAQDQWGAAGADSRQIFISLADGLELDVEAFGQCLASGRHDAVVQANQDEGISLGVRATPSFFINGFPVSGSQPFELFAYAVDLAEKGTLAEAYVQQPQQSPQQQPPITPSEPVDIPVGDAYSIGDPNAPIVIVEYTDFQCPYCYRHFQQTFPLLKSNFVDTGQVRYVFKDFPLTSIHPQAMSAAEAARCAGDQEAYLPMHDLLFNKQQEWSGRSDVDQVLAGYAGELGLDTTSFTECLSSNRHEAAIMADLDEGSGFGVTGTPAFFINGLLVSGAQPYEAFVQAIGAQTTE